MGGRLELRFTEERALDFQSFEFILWLPKKSLRALEPLTSLPRAS
jgi:hypothetical protein